MKLRTCRASRGPAERNTSNSAPCTSMWMNSTGRPPSHSLSTTASVTVGTLRVSSVPPQPLASMVPLTFHPPLMSCAGGRCKLSELQPSMALTCMVVGSFRRSAIARGTMSALARRSNFGSWTVPSGTWVAFCTPRATFTAHLSTSGSNPR